MTTTKQQPSLRASTQGRGRAKAPAYDVDQLRGRYPSLRALSSVPVKAGEKAWIAAFTHRPEALEDLLSDLIKQAYAKPGRIGQRPMPREDEVNLDALLSGEYTEEPLAVALPKLVKVSQRAFCAKVYMSKRTYQRIFLPESDPLKYYPDMALLQRIAEAVGKPPSYFLEYRLMAAQAAFLQLITDRPVIATRLYREFLVVARHSPFRKVNETSQ